MASNKNNQSEKKGRKHEPQEWSWDKMAEYAQFDGEVLGRGSSAVVYRGYKGQEKYAIKVITLEPPEDNENNHAQRKARLMSQWKNEVDYLNNSKLFHKNIVKLIAYGKEKEHMVNSKKQERWFLVYEHLHCSLEKQIKELTWMQVLMILKSTAEVLHFLHENDVIHNDLKPENLLLDKDFSIKLGDFGGATGSDRYADLNTPGYNPVSKTVKEVHATPAREAYSFGVCSLQLLMRIEKVEEDTRIVEMAKENKSKQGHVVDKQLLQSEGCSKEAAIQITEVALSCCKEHPIARSTMRKVAEELTRLLKQ